MKREIEIGVHHGVGPYTDVFGHGPVTIFNRPNEDGNPAMVLAACLDCGYVAHEIGLFAHEDCDRDDNPINQTWREYLEEEPFPEE